MRPKRWRIAGINFDHFHMGDLLRQVRDHPCAEIVGISDEQPERMEEAIRKLTSQPAETLRVKERGKLAPQFFADVVVFDPATIADKATYERPHQYAVGMRHVWVNGVRVLKDGEHTDLKPGRVVRGPGFKRAS